jgi:hypothetical protein
MDDNKKTTESQRRASFKYYHTHKDGIREKTKEYKKEYNKMAYAQLMADNEKRMKRNMYYRELRKRRKTYRTFECPELDILLMVITGNP